MDPVTLGIAGTEMIASTAASVGTTASIGSAITGAVSSLLGGIGQSQMSKYQAGVAEVNRQIASQNADYARKVGETQAQMSGMKTRAQVGETLARQGGMGFDVNRGSAANVRSSEEALGRFDQSVIRANAAKTAYGYQVEAMQYGTQAQMYRAAETPELVAGGMGAFSSLLGGAGSVASKWIQANQYGLVGGGGGSSDGGINLFG
jgi:hypothetical protein